MMMAKTSSTDKKTGTKRKPNAEKLISWYMDEVLVKGEAPRSIYKFSKEKGFEEQDFYEHFGSFEGLRKAIWERFCVNVLSVIDKSNEYDQYSEREKLLTFYFTFFEVLTANRSYVLFALNEHKMPLRNLEQLKGLRKMIRSYARSLVSENNEEKSLKIFKTNETVFSEGVWLQFLFLLKFWMDDNSANFESTDVAIEKSVNTVFDLMDTTPLERVVDFGKFLWKERMS